MVYVQYVLVSPLLSLSSSSTPSPRLVQKFLLDYPGDENWPVQSTYDLLINQPMLFLFSLLIWVNLLISIHLVLLFFQEAFFFFNSPSQRPFPFLIQCLVISCNWPHATYALPGLRDQLCVHVHIFTSPHNSLMTGTESYSFSHTQIFSLARG